MHASISIRSIPVQSSGQITPPDHEQRKASQGACPKGTKSHSRVLDVRDPCSAMFVTLTCPTKTFRAHTHTHTHSFHRFFPLTRRVFNLLQPDPRLARSSPLGVLLFQHDTDVPGTWAHPGHRARNQKSNVQRTVHDEKTTLNIYIIYAYLYLYTYTYRDAGEQIFN